MLADLGAAVALLLALGAVFWIMLRPVGAAQLQRRRWVVDGRHRDADPLGRLLGGPLLLLLLAVMDLVSAAGSASQLGWLGAATLGAIVAVLVQIPFTRAVVLLLVGVPALFLAAGQLLLGSGSPQLPGSTARVIVLLATAGFLVLVGVSRLVLAPLRASGAEARGAFLAVYGVLQAMIAIGALVVRGLLSAAEWNQVAIMAGLAVIIALGVAILPVFTTSVLGVGLLALDLVVGVVGGESDTSLLLASVAGALLVSWLGRLVRR